jgi:hypothetical protein
MRIVILKKGYQRNVGLEGLDVLVAYICTIHSNISQSLCTTGAANWGVGFSFHYTAPSNTPVRCFAMLTHMLVTAVL